MTPAEAANAAADKHTLVWPYGLDPHARDLAVRMFLAGVQWLQAEVPCRFMRPAQWQPCHDLYPGNQSSWCGACLIAKAEGR